MKKQNPVFKKYQRKNYTPAPTERRQSLWALHAYAETKVPKEFINYTSSGAVSNYIRNGNQSVFRGKDLSQWFKNDDFTFRLVESGFETPIYFRRGKLVCFCPDKCILLDGELGVGIYNTMLEKHMNMDPTLELVLKQKVVNLQSGGNIEYLMREGVLYLNEKVDFNVIVVRAGFGLERAYLITFVKEMTKQGVPIYYKYSVCAYVTLGVGLTIPIGSLVFPEVEGRDISVCPLPSSAYETIFFFFNKYTGLGNRKGFADEEVDDTTTDASTTSNSNNLIKEKEPESDEPKMNTTSNTTSSSTISPAPAKPSSKKEDDLIKETDEKGVSTIVKSGVVSMPDK